MKIYNERLKRKRKARKGDSSYLDYREESNKTRRSGKNGKASQKLDSIEDIIGSFFANKKRQVWDEETNVTKVTFEQLSPPTLTVESKTVVNGDKRPK
jgi:hypothetical protein